MRAFLVLDVPLSAFNSEHCVFYALTLYLIFIFARVISLVLISFPLWYRVFSAFIFALKLYGTDRINFLSTVFICISLRKTVRLYTGFELSIAEVLYRLESNHQYNSTHFHARNNVTSIDRWNKKTFILFVISNCRRIELTREEINICSNASLSCLFMK